HTRALLNTAEVITGEFVRHPETVFPRDATLALLREAIGEAEEIDATRLATLLAGHSIATNMFMLGMAWQRGLVPVGSAALMRAVELNGVAIEDNRRAFAWGRRAAHDMARVLRLARDAEAAPESQRMSRDLDEILSRRRAELVAYQGEALARRYVELVERVSRAEQRVAPGSERLALAVARQAHRLLAAKDEYEVARLFSSASFDAAIAADFEGEPRLHFHLAPPWRRAAADGNPRKQVYGPWMRSAMRLLARCKPLRGTLFDPFGWSAERRLERALPGDYEATVERLLRRLDQGRLDAAVAIAELPERIRGFGPVKLHSVQTFREREARLLAGYEADVPLAAILAQVA
ncbi:MAG: indolepyruvate ferredoxin oxidoreductase family protein, partial [Rhizobacter sp.]|nr:indolepyruvate ferredoxin oxidoreductase family protein [Rhizobacter sp.]